jgi:acyl-CoA hydrolase
MTNGKGRKLSLEEAARLIQPRDMVYAGLATGQPVGLLETLGARTDLEEVILHSAILVRPFSVLQNPAIRNVSGFLGPFERLARKQGFQIEYLSSTFEGGELLALRMKPRVVMAATTLPDADGWLNFGVHAGASFRPFVEAAADPNRLAIAEANPRMPRIAGVEELGGHRVHVSQIDAWVENDFDLLALPPEPVSAEDDKIAHHVVAQIEPESTLQFGIGAIPNRIADILAHGTAGPYRLHTEMFGDGAMSLHRAGKIVNRKEVYDGFSVATFAMGSAELYGWLDNNAEVRMLPVYATNDPAMIRRLRRFVSVNGALSIDLSGQVAADFIGSRQYSGTGGHESFIIGARQSPEGKSFLCLKSTATVDGKRISTIAPTLGGDARITTPRHPVQYVVTEYGAVDLSMLTDRERPRALLAIAHPDFREWLAREANL